MENLNKAETEDLVIKSTTEIVTAFLAANPMTPEGVKLLIEDVRNALRSGGAVNDNSRTTEKQTPAVPVDESLQGDKIICLECGEKFTSLKRHLAAEHKLSPNEYREKWDLGDQYPMISPAYSKTRSTLAKEMGLGGKVGKNR